MKEIGSKIRQKENFVCVLCMESQLPQNLIVVSRGLCHQSCKKNENKINYHPQAQKVQIMIVEVHIA